MSASLINKTVTGAAWVELRCPATVQINIQVSGAAVLVQVGDSPAGGGGILWEDSSEELLPGPYSFARHCDAVRVKALTTTQNAQVAIKALGGLRIGQVPR